MKFTRITIEPAVMVGVPTVRGATQPGCHGGGDGRRRHDPRAEILVDLPDLEAEDVREALRYTAEEVR